MPPVSRLSLPGLSFQAPLVSDDFEVEESVWATEILNRFQAVYGANFPSINRCGVISDVDPSGISSTILMPSVPDPNDPFTYTVSPGIAVTPNGQLIILTQNRSVTIPQVAGSTYYVVAEYNLIDSDYRILKLDKRVPAKRIVDDANLLKVISSIDYLNFPSDEILNKVVLGLVTVSQDLTTTIPTLTTSLDISKSNYARNRPWFSPVDIEHRSIIGNPHQTQIEDLDSGSVPLMEKFQGDGFLIAQDAQFPFFPGHLCIQELKRSEVTTAPPYTIPLPRSPVRLGRLHFKDGTYPPLSTNEKTDIAYSYDTVFNLITIPVLLPTPSGSYTYDMELETLVVDTFEPTLLTTVARIGDISTKGESAISQGQPIRGPMQTFDIPLNDFGPGAFQRARIHVKGDGTLIRTPQTLICQGRFGSDLPLDEDIPITTSIPFSGLPRIIVRDSVNFSCEVTLIGTDINDAPLQEVVMISFDKTLPNGVVPSVGPYHNNADNPSAFGKLVPTDIGASSIPPEFTRQIRLVTLASCPCRYAINAFKTLTAFRISNLVGGTSIGALTLQVLLDTRSLLQIAEVIEEEQVVKSLVDNRQVTTGLSQVNRGIWPAVQEADALIGEIGTGPNVKYLENFTDPKWGDFRSCNLLDPLNSSNYNGFGNTMYYQSRLLPANTSGSNIHVGIRIRILGDAFQSNVESVQIYYYKILPGAVAVLTHIDIGTTRDYTTYYGVDQVDAVMVLIRGRRLNGFALTVQPQY